MKKIIIIFVISAALIIGFIQLNKMPGRKMNRYEQAYQSIAALIGKAELCFKISPQAVHNGAAWNPRGYQLQYARSSCFYTVALNAKNPALCEEVVPLSTLTLDGSNYTADECKNKIILQSQASISLDNGSFGEEGVQWILNELGYTEDMIPAYLKENYKNDPKLYWYDYYLQIAFTPEFQNKLVSLPSFAD